MLLQNETEKSRYHTQDLTWPLCILSVQRGFMCVLTLCKDSSMSDITFAVFCPSVDNEGAEAIPYQ